MGEQLLPGAAPAPHRRLLGWLRLRGRSGSGEAVGALPSRRRTGTGEVVSSLGAVTVVGVLAVLAAVALVAGVIAVWPTGTGGNPRVAASRPPAGSTSGMEGRPDVMAPGSGPLAGRPGAQVAATGGVATAPVRLGLEAHVGSWDVSFRKTELREAPTAGERSRSDLARGAQVLETRVTVTNHGAVPADPGLDLLVGYLGPDGVEYNGDASRACPAREAAFGQGKIGPGETVRGTVCLGVPTRAVEGGAWVLRTPEEYTRPVVFAAR